MKILNTYTNTMTHRVTGCASCPFAFLSDGCLPTCVLDDAARRAANSEVTPYSKYGGLHIGADPQGGVQYAFREDAPDECPLRKSQQLVGLCSGSGLE